MTQQTPQAGPATGVEKRTDAAGGPPGAEDRAGSRQRPGRWFADYGWRHLCAVLALIFAFGASAEHLLDGPDLRSFDGVLRAPGADGPGVHVWRLDADGPAV